MRREITALARGALQAAMPMAGLSLSVWPQRRTDRSLAPRRRPRLRASWFVAVLAVSASPLLTGTALANPPTSSVEATQLVTGLAGGSGSTIGPDGALFVPEPEAGRIARVDPTTGVVTTFAGGLPAQKPYVGIGGIMDVAFLESTAYALVTLVGADVGGSDAVGIYRIDGPTTSTLVADIGAWASAHPPVTDFFIPTGVQYAMQPYRGGFLVTDGHHNRVLQVGLDGQVDEVVAFGDIVPTGLEVRGNVVYMAEAGPVPHLPAAGKVVSFSSKSPEPVEVAVGGRLLVDVELGLGNTLFALAQGTWTGFYGGEGSPADPNTGTLLKVDGHGGFSEVIGGLDRPTSMELIENSAYIVTFTGEIWRIDGIASPPFGRAP